MTFFWSLKVFNQTREFSGTCIKKSRTQTITYLYNHPFLLENEVGVRSCMFSKYLCLEWASYDLYRFYLTKSFFLIEIRDFRALWSKKKSIHWVIFQFTESSFNAQLLAMNIEHMTFKDCIRTSDKRWTTLLTIHI